MNTFNCVNSAEMHYGGWIKPIQKAESESEEAIQELESDPSSSTSSIIAPART